MEHGQPIQIENPLEKIKYFLEREEYRFSKHAIQRRIERSISHQDVIYVLTTGFHEIRKSLFDVKSQTWKYSIRGKTVDGADIRVIVALVEKMVVITVIRLTKKKWRRRL